MRESRGEGEGKEGTKKKYGGERERRKMGQTKRVQKEEGRRWDGRSGEGRETRQEKERREGSRVRLRR